MAFIKLNQALRELKKENTEIQVSTQSYKRHQNVSTKGIARGVGRELFDFLNLIKEWPLIVGKALATRTIPLKNVRGTLVIIVEHSVFAEQLSFIENELKNKIYLHFPSLKAQIKKISFISDSAQFKKQQQIQEKHATGVTDSTPKNEPHPLSPLYKKLEREAYQNMKEISELKDPEVKALLISLYIQNPHL